jgi:hypothetical protein
MTVTKEEIDTVVTQYQEYLGGKEALDKALKDRNSTLDEIRYSIETELLAKKLVTENTNVTDEELKAFYEKYGSQMFPTEAKKDAAGKDILPDFESKKSQIKEVYLNQQYVNGKDAWLLERKKSVNIINNYTTKPTYGLFKSTMNLINGLQGSK